MNILEKSHWITTVYNQSGYAEVSRNIFQQMINNNINFSFEHFDWDQGHMHPYTDYQFDKIKEYEQPINSRFNQQCSRFYAY